MSELHKRNLKETGQISRAALAWLRDQNLPNTPICYHVAFELFQNPSDDFKQIIAAVDGPIENKLATIEQVYRQYIIGKLDSNLSQFSERIDDVACKTLVTVSNTNEKLKDFSGNLEEATPVLEGTSEDAKIKVIALLLEETKKIYVYSNSLEDRLSDATREIKHLQQEHMAFRERAYRDPLTQILNRAGLQHEFDLISLNESMYPMSVMMADIDYFKSFNDEYGHLVGDNVIQIVATTLLKQIKHSDILARFGGEEFIIILPKTSLQNGLIVAESLRKEVSALKVKRRDTAEYLRQITLSIGVALLSNSDELIDCIDRADKALYRAKNAGRNRIEREND
ncbi:GGDEF domain-containing protein [Aliikangiella marina]|uniref:diguanylate cyclase n=1 Tax=Aliikangiella marina TaxID=1712262 RepID=A0A545TH34_9GAMM|nr:GGDEF domain-containing protein [Aliikangiella marina]TQV76544.1 GGDEF domain-containing protein [Aliikangiella marina]